MKVVKIAGALAVVIGLVAVAAVYAPTALGQVVVSTRGDDQPVVRILGGGGGQIGVSIRDVDKADVEREKLTGQWGAVVTEVRSDSPAERAGLQAGDVLIEFDGERVRSARQMSRLVDETPEGRTVKATVMRAGRRIDVDLTPDRRRAFSYMGESGRAFERLNRDLRLDLRMPELERLRDLDIPSFEFNSVLRTARLGVTVQELTPQLAEHLGAPHGVLVTSVNEDSAAAETGLKAGDVITALDGSSIESVSDLRRRLARLDAGDEFTIDIVRDKKPMSLKGKIEEERREARRRVITLL